jgi:hypothetical protein
MQSGCSTSPLLFCCRYWFLPRQIQFSILGKPYSLPSHTMETITTCHRSMSCSTDHGSPEVSALSELSALPAFPASSVLLASSSPSSSSAHLSHLVPLSPWVRRNSIEHCSDLHRQLLQASRSDTTFYRGHPSFHCSIDIENHDGRIKRCCSTPAGMLLAGPQAGVKVPITRPATTGCARHSRYPSYFGS